MEEETFSCSSAQSIKNYQVPDYMKKTQEDLQQVLLEVEEFQDKRKIIPYFAQYEFQSQKAKMHDFWGRTLENIMKKHEKSCLISIDYLYQIFNFNGFQPMSLAQVISELVEENNFSLASNKLKIMKMLNLDTTSELKEEEKKKEYGRLESEKQQKKSGIFAKLNIFNYFKGTKEQNQSGTAEENMNQPQQNDNSEQNNFIINKKLIVKHFSKFKQFLNNYPWNYDHFSFENDIIQAAEKEGLNIGEVKLFLELLEKDGQVKTFGYKEIGQKITFYDKDKISSVNVDYFTNTSVLFLLEHNIHILEKNIQKYTEQQYQLKKKIMECTETQKTKKNQYLREYLVLQKTIDNILNKKQTLKNNQLNVEDAITNKRVLNILNKGVETAKQNQVDVSLIEDIKEQIQSVNEQEKEVHDIFEQFNSLDQQQQQDIDNEIQQLMQETEQSSNQNLISNNLTFLKNNPTSNQQNQYLQSNNINNNYQTKNTNNNAMDEEEEDPQLKLLNELA